MNLMQHVHPGHRALGRMTGLILLASGAVSILSGATGHNFASRLYTGGWLSLNDAVPGIVLLAVGLFLLRVSGGSPLRDQVSATAAANGSAWAWSRPDMLPGSPWSWSINSWHRPGGCTTGSPV